MRLNLRILLVAAATIAASAAASSETKSSFEPPRISYGSLFTAEGDEAFVDALTGVGMISITDVPWKMEADQNRVLRDLASCVVRHQQNSEGLRLQTRALPDGTVRKTVAAHSVDGNGDALSVLRGSTTTTSSEDEACRSLERESAAFRSTIAEATSAVASKLQRTFFPGSDAAAPASIVRDRSGVEGYTFADVVTRGEHLEHFHVYEKKGENGEPAGENNEKTLEWHTDQGLALLFVPGRFVSVPADGAAAAVGEVTSGFHVLLKDGSTAEVKFDDQKDDLILMLGDGVNQYVNDRIDSDAPKLRALPHSLVVPPTTEAAETETVRAWYGLMVLPPADAVHPTLKETFGELRTKSNRGRGAGDVADASLGCSPMSTGGAVPASTISVSRKLQDDSTSCEDDEGNFYCWHRCFNSTEIAEPRQLCASKGLGYELQCVSNMTGVLWDGESHGEEYKPGCVATDDADATNGGSATETNGDGATETNGEGATETNGDHDMDHDDGDHEGHDHDEDGDHEGHDHEMSDTAAKAASAAVGRAAAAGLVAVCAAASLLLSAW